MTPDDGIEAAAAALAARAGARPDRLDGVVKLMDLSAATLEDGRPDEVALRAAVSAVELDVPEWFHAAPDRARKAHADFNVSHGRPRYSAAWAKEAASKRPGEFSKVLDDYIEAIADDRVDP